MISDSLLDSDPPPHRGHPHESDSRHRRLESNHHPDYEHHRRRRRRPDSPERGPDYELVDRFGLVYTIFALFGAGVLWPFNTIISVPDFFDNVVRPYNILTLMYTYPSQHMEYLLPAAMNLPNMLMLFLVVKYGDRFSFSIRIISCFAMTAVLLGILPLVTHLGVISFETSFSLLIVIVFALGIVVAVLQSAIFGFAGMLPQVYTQAVMMGNGLAGLGVAILRMITKASFPDSAYGLRESATLYFLLSAFISILCIAAYVVLVQLPFTKHHMHARPGGAIVGEDSDLDSETASDIERVGLMPVPHDPSVDLHQLVASPFNFHSIADPAREPPQLHPQVSKREVIRKVLPNGLVVYSVFLVTLLTFPGLISDLKSSTGIPHSWFTLILIAEFNFFDTVGRSLPRWCVLISPERLWIAGAGRIALYPAFIMANVGVAFTGDLSAFLLVAILALSNGYVGSLGMMFGPDLVDDHQKETAGYIMTFFLMFGIVSGLVTAAIMTELHLF